MQVDDFKLKPMSYASFDYSHRRNRNIIKKIYSAFYTKFKEFGF